MWPHRRQPTRLPIPGILQASTLEWVALSFSNACKWKVKSESEVAQSRPTLHDPMDCSSPGSSVRGILQARVLEWGAIAFSAWHLGTIWKRREKQEASQKPKMEKTSLGKRRRDGGTSGHHHWNVTTELNIPEEKDLCFNVFWLNDSWKDLNESARGTQQDLGKENKTIAKRSKSGDCHLKRKS